MFLWESTGDEITGNDLTSQSPGALGSLSCSSRGSQSQDWMIVAAGSAAEPHHRKYPPSSVTRDKVRGVRQIQTATESWKTSFTGYGWCHSLFFSPSLNTFYFPFVVCGPISDPSPFVPIEDTNLKKQAKDYYFQVLSCSQQLATVFIIFIFPLTGEYTFGALVSIYDSRMVQTKDLTQNKL